MMTIASLVVAASLFIPQGSDEQIKKNPLEKGEVAYVEDENTAYISIGKDSGKKCTVADQSALRGYEYEYLDRKSFIVLPITNLTRNAGNDTLTFDNFTDGVTNTFKFKFIIPSGTQFDAVEFKHKIRLNAGHRIIQNVNIRKIVSGNEVIVIMNDVTDKGVEMIVSDFKVRCLAYGNPDYVNDLTKKVIKIHDSASEDKTLKNVGDWKLGDWRKRLLHFYDGNRGENWASYDATNNVIMNDRQLSFGRQINGIREYSISQSPTDSNAVVTTYFGRDAIRVYAMESTAVASSLHFNSIVVGDTNVVFAITVSNGVFTANNLHMFSSYKYGKKHSAWHEIPFTVTSQSPLKISVAKEKDGECYYSMMYGNSSVVVEIPDTLKANKVIVKDANGEWKDVSTWIGTKVSTNDVNAIIAASNLCTVASAQAMTNALGKAKADAFLTGVGLTMTNKTIYAWTHTEPDFTAYSDRLPTIGLYGGVDCFADKELTIPKYYKRYDDTYRARVFRPTGGNMWEGDGSAATYTNDLGQMELSATNAINISTNSAKSYADATFAPKLTGHTYDFANGSNFTLRLYTALTNVIQTLGGTVTNAPAFN